MAVGKLEAEEGRNNQTKEINKLMNKQQQQQEQQGA